MKIKDKELKVLVDVFCADCQKFTCYWPRQNPGMFTQGQGYRAYGDSRDKEYLCGNREIRGCPNKPELKKSIEILAFKENYKTWVAFYADENGDQVGNCDYGCTKKQAIFNLTFGSKEKDNDHNNES